MHRRWPPRSPHEWQQITEDNLGRWWAQWEAPLRRNDPLLPTLEAGDNLAFFARQMGVGRSQWLARALVDADMWDRHVLVLCRPMLRLYWRQTLSEAGMDVSRVEIVSCYKAAQSNLDAEVRLHEAFARAEVVIIEPAARPKTKQFAGLAKQVRAAHHHPQIITTATMHWTAQFQPPAYADSCLKLLGYLDAPEDVRVCWAEDCWEAAA